MIVRVNNGRQTDLTIELEDDRLRGRRADAQAVLALIFDEFGEHKGFSDHQWRREDK